MKRAKTVPFQNKGLSPHRAPTRHIVPDKKQGEKQTVSVAKSGTRRNRQKAASF